MKVLWITNNLLPDICDYLGASIQVKTGWLESCANQIKNDVELYVASLYNCSEIQIVNLNNIKYILVPFHDNNRHYNSDLEQLWKKINQEINPDVVHIHGTEYPTGLSYIKSCGNNNVVISIQGLISICHKYYNAGLSTSELFRYTTIRDVIKRNTLWHQAKQFAKQGIFEREYLNVGYHFIGRTTWDKANILALNPNARYHFNNETLRDSFYNSSWQIEKIRRNSIFCSQATYPLKGLHMLLKAMPIILRKYPDTVINVAGYDMTETRKGKFGIFKSTTYGNILYNFIKKYKLDKHIFFLGRLNEEQMKSAYLSSHLFINTSAVENSSNSIGEAQILGVPVIASFVGGSDTMTENGKGGLMYPFDDIERLAYNVISIFSDDNLARNLSIEERNIALSRHDKLTNKEQLYKIYQDIVGCQ